MPLLFALPGLLSRWDVRLVLLNVDGAERPDTGTGAGRAWPGPAARVGRAQARHPLLTSG